GVFMLVEPSITSHTVGISRFAVTVACAHTPSGSFCMTLGAAFPVSLVSLPPLMSGLKPVPAAPADVLFASRGPPTRLPAPPVSELHALALAKQHTLSALQKILPETCIRNPLSDGAQRYPV